MAIGGVFEAKGDLAAALSAYRESVAIRRALSAADSSNNGLRCDLAASLIKTGDILEAQGDLAGAFGAYRETLDIARELSEREPQQAQWQSDLVSLKEKIGLMARSPQDEGSPPPNLDQR
jgi:tetratricopeptide (TPR) repeat protein